MKKIFKNLSNIDKAYLAGFLDGNGSIIIQIVHDKTRKYKFNIKISIVFYQKNTNYWFILYLQKKFKPHGYIRRRNDMSEFTIVGKEPVKLILKELYPYFVFKKSLVRLVINIIKEIEKVESEADFLKVCKMVDETAKYTNSNKRKITYDYVQHYLNSPVETSFVKKRWD